MEGMPTPIGEEAVEGNIACQLSSLAQVAEELARWSFSAQRFHEKCCCAGLVGLLFAGDQLICPHE